MSGTATVRRRRRADVRAEMLQRRRVAGRAAPPTANGRGITSDLSVDEALLLHAAGWEPLDLVCGVARRLGARRRVELGPGRDRVASRRPQRRGGRAAAALRGECAKVHGHGVVGVRVEVEVRPHHIDVALVGTAVRPVDGPGPTGAAATPFVSDLSARDFTLLAAGRLDAGRPGLRRQLRLRPPAHRRHGA